MFECKEGCSDCCGPVPIDSELILDNISRFQYSDYEWVANVPVCKDFKCIFLNRKTAKCEIYDKRPEVCRNFGTNPTNQSLLYCPHQKPNGNDWSPAKKRSLDRKCKHIFDYNQKRFS